MPSRLALIVSSLCIVALTIIYFAKNNPMSALTQASLGTNNKSNPLKNLDLMPSNEILVRTQKILPEFKVYFYKDAADHTTSDSDTTTDRFYPEVKIGEPFELTAHITVERPTAKMNYEWLLPPGVQMSSAANPTKGELYNLSPYQITKVSAWFVSVSDNNEKIHFRATTSSKNRTSSQTAQFNTLEQKIIDDERKKIAENHTKYLIENPDLLKRNE